MTVHSNHVLGAFVMLVFGSAASEPQCLGQECPSSFADDAENIEDEFAHVQLSTSNRGNRTMDHFIIKGATDRVEPTSDIHRIHPSYCWAGESHMLRSNFFKFDILRMNHTHGLSQYYMSEVLLSGIGRLQLQEVHRTMAEHLTNNKYYLWAGLGIALVILIIIGAKAGWCAGFAEDEEGELPEFDMLSPAVMKGHKSVTVSLGFLRKTARLDDYMVIMGMKCLSWLANTAPGCYFNVYIQAHGVSAQNAGIALAVQPFTIVAVQPVLLKLRRELDRDYILLFGIFVWALSMGIYSCGPTIAGGDPNKLFATFCFTAFLAGCGEAILRTSLNGMMQSIFPDVVGQVAGHAEGWAGIGTAAGPLIGGYLYQMGGFPLPTAFTTITFLVFGLLVARWSYNRRNIKKRSASKGRMPFDEGNAELAAHGEVGGQQQGDSSMFLLITIGLIIAGVNYGVFFPLLAFHYALDYGMAENRIGMLFGVYGFVYIVGAVLAGRFTDGGPTSAKICFLVGVAAASICIALMGPDTPLWCTVFGNLAMSVSDSWIATPAISLLMRSNPFSDNGMTTIAMSACVAFGMCIGPFLALPLDHALGLRYVTFAVSGILVVFFVAASVVFARSPV